MQPIEKPKHNNCIYWNDMVVYSSLGLLGPRFLAAAITPVFHHTVGAI